MNARHMYTRKSVFYRFYIEHLTDHSLAWSGSKWAKHAGGLPAKGAQLCSFETREECDEYIFNFAKIEQRNKEERHRQRVCA